MLETIATIIYGIIGFILVILSIIYIYKGIKDAWNGKM